MFSFNFFHFVSKIRFAFDDILQFDSPFMSKCNLTRKISLIILTTSTLPNAITIPLKYRCPLNTSSRRWHDFSLGDLHEEDAKAKIMPILGISNHDNPCPARASFHNLPQNSLRNLSTTSLA